MMDERDMFVLRRLCASLRYHLRTCAGNIYSLSLLNVFHLMAVVRGVVAGKSFQARKVIIPYCRALWWAPRPCLPHACVRDQAASLVSKTFVTTDFLDVRPSRPPERNESLLGP